MTSIFENYTQAYKKWYENGGKIKRSGLCVLDTIVLSCIFYAVMMGSIIIVDEIKKIKK